MNMVCAASTNVGHVFITIASTLKCVIVLQLLQLFPWINTFKSCTILIMNELKLIIDDTI